MPNEHLAWHLNSNGEMVFEERGKLVNLEKNLLE